VVDRAVGHRPDRDVREGAPAEEPDVARGGGGDGVVERERGVGHATYPKQVRVPWKLIGLAGVASVAASGAVVVRRRRGQQEYDPEALREKLHERLAATRGVSGAQEPAVGDGPGPGPAAA